MVTSDDGVLAEPGHVLAELAQFPPEPVHVLAEPARFLTALLDSLAVGVVACNDAGQVVLMNRPVREILGLPEDGSSPLGYARTAVAAIQNADGSPIPLAGTPLRRALRGAAAAETDIHVRIPGRRDRILATTARRIGGSDDRTLGAIAVAHEVTALRRAERFRTCHAHVQQHLKAAGSVVEAAPGVLEAVGTTLGWPAAELWLIDDATGHLDAVGQWGAPGTDFGEILGQRIDRGFGITGRVWETGKPIWVPDIAVTTDLQTPAERAGAEACIRQGIHTVLGVPVHDADTLLGVLTCFAGAPEQHEDLLTVLLDGVAAQIGVYVALRRAEELARQLTRSKDDFIALVSHEMRTPLTAIVANVAMLAEDAAGLDEERRHMVASVARNANALSDVVDLLLDLAGLDSGYLDLTVRRIDLAEIVTAALTQARPAAADAGVRLGEDPPGPSWLDGDALRLRQVVDDLLANAIRYSAAGGAVQLAIRTDCGGVELEVSDLGIGTPADERERVFERFYRGSNVRHQGIPGRGLGLSRARAIVDLHGGTIRLSDNRPHGTTVLVRLPGGEIESATAAG
jgi:signal transduction histidine kinase